MKVKIGFVRLSSGYIQMRKNANFTDGTRLTYSTGVKLPKEHWDNKNQRQKRRTKNANQNNTRLNTLEARFIELLNLYTVKGEKPSIKLLKQELKKALGEHKVLHEQEEKVITFLEFAKLIIKEREAGIRRTKKGTKFAPGTIRGNKSRLKVIEKFLAQENLTNIPFEEINLQFEKRLMKYLRIKGEVESINSLSNYTRFIKMVMNQGLDEHHQSTAFKKMKKFSVDVENVYLSEEELHIIYNLDLSDYKLLDEVRDLFLIGAETGLRFSDFSVIKPDNIVFEKNEPKQISIKNQKTKKYPTIPIKRLAQKIMLKYNYQLPKEKSNYVFNKAIKQICELAGFVEEMTLVKGKGEESNRKCEFVTTHTARRSFARISYINRIPIIWIMQVLGHSKESETLKYIGMSNLELGNMIANNDFFQKSYEERKSEHTHLKAI